MIEKNIGNIEIEMKYLIRENKVNYAAPIFWNMFPSIYSLKKSTIKNGVLIHQGYFNQEDGTELTDKLFSTELDFVPHEFRMRDKDENHYFTIKGEGTISRRELEVEISKKVFDKYWPMTSGNQLIKKRLNIPFQDYVVEIDVYLDRDLIVAEIEVPTIEIANGLIPLGNDITHNLTYKNKNLAR